MRSARSPLLLLGFASAACTAHIDVETLSTADTTGESSGPGEPTSTGGEPAETGESTPAGPEHVCGDAVVEAPFEECDDANKDNTDACLNSCRFSFCGDGYLQLPGEQCDDGNHDDSDECPGNCQLANCGDGYVGPGEACDDAGESPNCDADCSPRVCGDGVLNQTAGEVCDDGNVVEDDGCTGVCEGYMRTVFVTDQVFAADLGGLPGADARCQAAADAAALPGTYMAWLSDDTGEPATRMFRSNGPYGLPDGTRVADDWTDFSAVAAVLRHPIDMTETGAVPPVYDPTCNPYPCAWVWTNTQLGVQDNVPHSCANWTDTAGESSLGRWNAIDGFWTAAASGRCFMELPLYCFEQ